MHIRNLMITYFFKLFEQLVHDGHVWFWKRRSSARLRTANSNREKHFEFDSRRELT